MMNPYLIHHNVNKLTLYLGSTQKSPFRYNDSGYNGSEYHGTGLLFGQSLQLA